MRRTREKNKIPPKKRIRLPAVGKGADPSLSFRSVSFESPLVVFHDRRLPRSENSVIIEKLKIVKLGNFAGSAVIGGGFGYTIIYRAPVSVDR